MKFKFKILLTISALILFFSLNTLMCRAQNQSEMSEQGCQLLSELEEIQTEMNEQTYQTYEQADKKLNDIYKQILEKHKDNEVFISKLKKAQVAWVSFRDAHIESIYPEEDKRLYGSVYPMCVNQIKIGITQQRIKELKLWLEGICEGNVCSGSRPFKDEKFCLDK